MISRGRNISMTSTRHSKYSASRNTQTNGPNRVAASTGKNNSIGPTITNPITAMPSAATSRAPDTSNGRRDKLIAPSNNR